VKIAELLAANALMFVVGLGLLPLIGAARSWRELGTRSTLAYVAGIGVIGILSAHLALVRVSVGWPALGTMAGLSVVAGTLRLRGTERIRWERQAWISIAGLVASLLILVEYGRAFAVATLDRYDAWAIWTLKGHALYAFGWADPNVFANDSYRSAHLEYPLFLPSLEAVDFRVMHAYDTQLVHIQFLLLLVAALIALAGTFRGLVPGGLLWLSLIAMVLAPALFDQLLSAYADVPLALFLAVGLASTARWVLTNERWALAFGALCFGACVLLKNEGTLFVMAALIGLALTVPKRWRSLALVAVCELVVVLLPWHVFTAVHRLKGSDFRLTDSFDVGRISTRLGIGAKAFGTLGEQMIDPRQWGLLFFLFLIALIVAFHVELRSLALYGVVFVGISWAGLSWIYVISHLPLAHYLDVTKTRVVASIVLGGAALMPFLAAESWRVSRPENESGEASSG
jgi:hypothetical protein